MYYKIQKTSALTVIVTNKNQGVLGSKYKGVFGTDYVLRTKHNSKKEGFSYVNQYQMVTKE
jgi:hypothetical protein